MVSDKTIPNEESFLLWKVYSILIFNLISCIYYYYFSRCGHCKQFAPQYEAVALHFHKRNKQIEEKEINSNSDQNNNNNSKEKRKVKVGQVDGTSERALAHRFNVKAYPSFFLVDGWTVREYTGYRRSQQSMIEFVEKTHTKADPIPMMASPFGKCLPFKVQPRGYHTYCNLLFTLSLSSNVILYSNESFFYPFIYSL